MPSRAYRRAGRRPECGRTGPGGSERRAGGEVEGVDPHAGGAEVDVGAADGLGEAPVFVLGVDDRDLDPAYKERSASSLARYDLPAPERARMTEL